MKQKRAVLAAAGIVAAVGVAFFWMRGDSSADGERSIDPPEEYQIGGVDVIALPVMSDGVAVYQEKPANTGTDADTDTGTKDGAAPEVKNTADAVASDPELTKRYGKYLGDNALEVGSWIGRPFWGKGYMPEALTAVLGYAFDTLRKDAVWGGHFAENTQSERVQAKCGLHVVAESKQDYYPLIDRHYDRVYRIITAGEWRDAEHRQMARMIA